MLSRGGACPECGQILRPDESGLRMAWRERLRMTAREAIRRGMTEGAS